MRSAARRGIAAVLLAVLVAGCYSWRHEQYTRAWPTETTLRITRQDASQVMLWRATLAGDSVAGLISTARGRTTPHAVALSDIFSVESRHLNIVKTTGLTVLVLVPVATLLVLSTFDFCSLGC